MSLDNVHVLFSLWFYWEGTNFGLDDVHARTSYKLKSASFIPCYIVHVIANYFMGAKRLVVDLALQQ